MRVERAYATKIQTPEYARPRRATKRAQAGGEARCEAWCRARAPARKLAPGGEAAARKLAPVPSRSGTSRWPLV